jgi:lipoprotein signal peptidase
MMMTTILTASAVLAAEYGIRRHVNAAPKAQFPKPLGKQYELRQAHNFGIVGSRFEGKPRLVLAYQTGATTVAVVGAVLVSKTIGAAHPLVRIGAGLAAGGALSNMIERWTSGYVTDYLHGTSAPIPLLQKRIWNVADMAIFNGCVIALIGAAV